MIIDIMSVKNRGVLRVRLRDTVTVITAQHRQIIRKIEQNFLLVFFSTGPYHNSAQNSV